MTISPLSKSFLKFRSRLCPASAQTQPKLSPDSAKTPTQFAVCLLIIFSNQKALFDRLEQSSTNPTLSVTVAASGPVFSGRTTQKGWIRRMSKFLNTAAGHGPHAKGTASLQQAQRDYYDCMSRYGCDSAEAHVAQILWRKLRSKTRLCRTAPA